MNRKELFYISITIFLTIIAWLILEVYKVETAIKVGEQALLTVEKRIILDTSVFKILKNKQSP